MNNNKELHKEIEVKNIYFERKNIINRRKAAIKVNFYSNINFMLTILLHFGTTKKQPVVVKRLVKEQSNQLCFLVAHKKAHFAYNNKKKGSKNGKKLHPQKSYRKFKRILQSRIRKAIAYIKTLRFKKRSTYASRGCKERNRRLSGYYFRCNSKNEPFVDLYGGRRCDISYEMLKRNAGIFESSLSSCLLSHILLIVSNASFLNRLFCFFYLTCLYRGSVIK